MVVGARGLVDVRGLVSAAGVDVAERVEDGGVEVAYERWSLGS